MEGRNNPAARNSAASPPVHGHSPPECQAFIKETAAKAAAITNPNERSDPATTFSPRPKTSCVDCFISVRDIVHVFRRRYRGLRGRVLLDHSRGHKRCDRRRIFLQSLEIKMHITFPIEILGMRSKPLLQCLGGIEEKKVVGSAHSLHRRADKIVPQAARGVGFQVLKM